jgi:hypothetical protein
MHGQQCVRYAELWEATLIKKEIKKSVTARFRADDIVRAIEAVQQAGLTIYGVEITLNGSISINTTSHFKRPAPKPETEDAQEEVKKRA